MALTKEAVEKWIYPDVRPELDAIREDVLTLLTEAEEGAKFADALALAEQELADVKTERDALAGRVLEIEEMIAAEEKAAQ